MLRLRNLVLAFLSSIAASAPTARDPATGVTYEGLLSEGGTVEYFHGIRYAKDTSGNGRFAPPELVSTPPKGTLINATRVAPACPQLQIDLPPVFNKPSEISEDCLSVFIARPANTKVEQVKGLPVLAWIPGGGAHYGSGTDSHTDPEKLINLSVELDEPVIFVGINYRLGIFGFAASDELHNQKSQNNGLRDQRLAFEWLKQNIATFGGDPNRITAYGLSAGGTTLSLQHVAFGGEHGVPFDQAYMMSGPPGTAVNQTSDASKVNTANVAKRISCPSQGQEMLDCLRKVDLQELVTEAWNYGIEGHPPIGLFTFVPVVDDDFLPEQASKLYRDGKFAKNIPTIMAWTENDGDINIGPASMVHDEDSLIQALHPWIGSALSKSQLAELLAVYPVEDFEEQAKTYNQQKAPDAPDASAHWYRGSTIFRDIFFTCSSIDFAHQKFRQTRESGLDPDFDKVWVYQLSQSMLNPIFNSVGMDYVGIAHGSDTNYIFNGVFPEGEVHKGDLQLSRQFASSIIHFATTGDPINQAGAETFSEWRSAFSAQTKNGDERGLVPSDLDLLVIGGPYGTTPVHISLVEEEENTSPSTREADNSTASVVAGFEGLQQIVMQPLDHANTTAASKAKAAIEMQKLFKRCTFVNSLAESLGA